MLRYVGQSPTYDRTAIVTPQSISRKLARVLGSIGSEVYVELPLCGRALELDVRQRAFACIELELDMIVSQSDRVS